MTPGRSSRPRPEARDRAGIIADAKDLLKIAAQIFTVAIAAAALGVSIHSTNVARHGQDLAVVEFKNNLVHNLAEPTSDVLTSARFIVSGTLAIGGSGLAAHQANQQEYLRLKREWAEARGELNATLATDYGSGLANGWLDFSGDVAAYLQLSYGDPPSRKKAFRHLESRINPDALKTHAEGKECSPVQPSWLRPLRARATIQQESHFRCAYDAEAALLRFRLGRFVMEVNKQIPAFAL